MAHFNYQNLSPEEFEALAKDVMQRLLGVSLFRYAAGQDGGIDLCENVLTHRIIVQCKRYAQNVQVLLQSLKAERKKLELLVPTPERYYVFTSVALSPQQKAKVLELFQAYMESEENIIDQIAIEDFFNDPKNHDLIQKNQRLFVSYPAGYDHKESRDWQALRESLDELLRNTWKAHRSYKLMQTDEIDRRLFPNIQDAAQFEALGKRKEEDTESPVWSIIRESWNEETNRPVMIQGKGGIGKTVTLFSLTNLGKDLIPAPAVYVPMFELVNQKEEIVNLSDYFQAAEFFPSLTPKQREELCSLAARPWDKGPSLLVLLDGFNEVPGNQRWNVLRMLRTWHEKNQGAQLIAVSRPMDNLSLESAFGKETISVTLSELTKESVTAYLKSPQGDGVRIPESNAPIWETIVYPLFLNLYIKADRLRDQQAWKDYPLNIRGATSPGSIIWNYLQRELLRQEDDQWVLRCALACEYFAPILAHHMLHSYDYTISRREALAVIKKAVSELDLKRMPNHITELLSRWEELELSAELPVFLKKLNWPDILLRECGLLVPYREVETDKDKDKKEPRFEFLHQIFRDCLAGLYLVNQAEMSCENSFPDPWADLQSNLALNYAAELIDPVVLDRLWEVNREAQQYKKARFHRNHTATYNLLELYRRNDSLRAILEEKHLNFSGMDLCGLSLTNYLGKNGKPLPLFRDPSLSADTAFDRAVFQSSGHTASVYILAVLPDGRVVSTSEDFTLRVWDAASGQCMQTLVKHRGTISCVSILPDGRVVSGSWDGTLRVWDVASGQCLQTLEGHSGGVNCVAVLSDGRVVSGSRDCTLRVWDTTSGKCMETLKGHSDWVSCVAVLQDGRVVSGSYDRTLRVWDTASGKCMKTLKGHSDWVFCVAVLQDGRVVSGSHDRNLRVWDAASGKCLHTLKGHRASVSCMTVLPDGRVVSGSHDRTLRVWDAATGQCLQILKGHIRFITCVAVLPDGRVVSGSGDCTLQVWDVDTGQCLKNLEGHSYQVNFVAVLLDGRVVSGSDDRTLRVWDPDSGQCLQTQEGHSDRVNCVAVLPDEHVVSGSNDCTLRVWNAATGQCLQTLKGHIRCINCVAVLPDGRVVSGSGDCTLRVWDVDTGQCLQTLEGHGDQVNCVAVLLDGRVVSGSNDRTLRVWDPDSGRCLKIIEVPRIAVLRVCVLPDGRVVSHSYGSNAILVWDIATGQCLKTLEGHIWEISCVAVLPDGRVVIGANDGSLQVWDVDTGQCLQTLIGHYHYPACLTILPDGRVVSGSWDGTMRVWDSDTGQCLQTLEGDMNVFKCVAALPNGRVVSGSDDSTLRVWDPDCGECLDIFEATEVPVSGMDFSSAEITEDLVGLLYHNGAKISKRDYLRWAEANHICVDKAHQ